MIGLVVPVRVRATRIPLEPEHAEAGRTDERGVEEAEPARTPNCTREQKHEHVM